MPTRCSRFFFFNLQRHTGPLTLDKSRVHSLRLLPTSPLEVAASFSSTIPMVMAASGTGCQGNHITQRNSTQRQASGRPAGSRSDGKTRSPEAEPRWTQFSTQSLSAGGSEELNHIKEEQAHTGGGGGEGRTTRRQPWAECPEQDGTSDISDFWMMSVTMKWTLFLFEFLIIWKLQKKQSKQASFRLATPGSVWIRVLLKLRPEKIKPLFHLPQSCNECKWKVEGFSLQFIWWD